MWPIAFCTLAACALTACDSLPGKPTEADRPLRPEQVTSFEVLYGENCAGCHGADGRLGGARPLNDPIYLAWTDRGAFARVTKMGVPDTLMPGFAIEAGGMLTDEQVEIITDGAYQRWAKPADTAGAAIPSGLGPGDAQRGAAAYATFCAGCHGADGRGGANGGSVVDGSYLGLVSDRALRAAVVCGRPDLGMPDWRGYVRGRPMSEQEVADVVAWLIAQRPQFPGQPYAETAAR